jgi:hypothetical protein
LPELYENPDGQGYKYAKKKTVHAAAFSTGQRSTGMHGCDVLPRLPEEESKSLVSQSTTVVAREISKYPAKHKIVYTKTCTCHEVLSFVPKLIGWFLRNDFMALRGMTILYRYE